MQVILLYAVIVLIWGSTWLAIPYQLGVVAEETSVGYRFGLAAIMLYAYALLSRRQIRLPIDAYPVVALQGTLLFCLAYFFVYYGAGRLTSGLVALLFSSIVLTNATFERIFFRIPFERRILVAALLGIGGIEMILQLGFVVSLGYLAVFGSAIAFGCYLALIRHIGSARAAYTSVLYPLVALGISTVVEGYQ